MSTFNRKAVLQGLTTRNITAQVHYSNSKTKNKDGLPNTVSAITVSGYMFDRMTNMTKDEINMLLDDIACDVKKAYEHHTYRRNSVAKQKVNTAHGRTDYERENNQNEQSMTYADACSNVQHFNRAWYDVLTQVVEGHSYIGTIEDWKKAMKDIHGTEKSINRAIENKQVRIINGKVVSDFAMRENLKRFSIENFNKEFSEKTCSDLIDLYCTVVA